MERKQLGDLVLRFTEAFNRDDLDGVMSFMADDAIYDEFNGRQSRGKQAIREAFVPQFRGDYGRIRFQTEDLFVDPDSGKALIRWLCTLESDGRFSAWRGLDILRFEEGLLAPRARSRHRIVPSAASASPECDPHRCASRGAGTGEVAGAGSHVPSGGGRAGPRRSAEAFAGIPRRAIL